MSEIICGILFLTASALWLTLSRRNARLTFLESECERLHAGVIRRQKIIRGLQKAAQARFEARQNVEILNAEVIE